MKNRTRRWLKLARNWGIFLGACIVVWLIVKAAYPNVNYALKEKYFSRRNVETLGEMTFTDYIEDICDPETEISTYEVKALMAGDVEGITYTDSLYILNDRYFVQGEDFTPLLETTEIEGYGSVTMVRGAAEALTELLSAAEAEMGQRFILGDSYIDGAVAEKDVGNDCYMLEYYDTSEHITGTSIDLCIEGVDFHNYMTSDLAKWLQDNAWRFGFVIRYPFWEGEWTGVFFQPWHIHYVGQPHAALLYDSRMPLEEYVQKQYPSDNRYYLIDGYVIFKQTSYEGTIYIPDTLSDVEVSYDNQGYYYVTGKLEKES